MIDEKWKKGAVWGLALVAVLVLVLIGERVQSWGASTAGPGEAGVESAGAEDGVPWWQEEEQQQFLTSSLKGAESEDESNAGEDGEEEWRAPFCGTGGPTFVEEDLGTGEGDSPFSNFSKLEIFSEVIAMVDEHYFEPGGLAPMEMMVAILEGIAARSPGVSITPEASVSMIPMPPALRSESYMVFVSIDGETRIFSLGALDSLKSLMGPLQEIIKYIEGRLNWTALEHRAMEYCAIEDLLATLDEDSLFLWPSMTEFMEGQMPGAAATRAESGTSASVEGQLLSNQVGYLQIRIFGASTASEVMEKLRHLESTSGGLNAIVLDLRGNPGGLLAQAVEVSDLFLNRGPIVIIDGPKGPPGGTQQATENTLDVETPLIVLVDGETAAAAEIVAGALGDHSRALVVGERTRGRGMVQVLFVLADSSAVQLTVAQYLRPLRTPIRQGIQPFYDFEDVHISARIEARWLLGVLTEIRALDGQ